MESEATDTVRSGALSACRGVDLCPRRLNWTILGGNALGDPECTTRVSRQQDFVALMFRSKETYMTKMA